MRNLVLSLVLGLVAGVAALGALFGDVSVSYPQNEECGSVAFRESLVDDSEYSLSHREKACDAALNERIFQGVGAAAVAAALVVGGIVAFARGRRRRREARDAYAAHGWDQPSYPAPGAPQGPYPAPPRWPPAGPNGQP